MAEPKVQQSTPKKMTLEEMSREELINKCQGFLVLAQKAKTTKNELQKQIEDYKKQLAKSEADHKVSEENIRTLQELVDSLTEQKLNYITEIDATKQKLSAIQLKLEEHENQITKYETELKENHKEIANITQKLSEVDSENISLKRQNNRLLEENEQLINQLTELESKIEEFNIIGLQQREQLQKLEEKSVPEEEYKLKIDELQSQIKDLEHKLKNENAHDSDVVNNQIKEYETKIKDMTNLYESEKAKNDKANIKLRSYKDKILKCAACINQLKNSRYILAKTVKEYSECIPKWRTDIINASKILEIQVNQLQNENVELRKANELLENELQQNVFKATESLKNELSQVKDQLNESTFTNKALGKEISDLKNKYQRLSTNEMPTILNENENLKTELNKCDEKIKQLILEKQQLEELVKSSVKENKSQIVIENLNLQIKALENEKTILVKEKLSARDNVVELENENKTLTDKLKEVTSELNSVKTNLSVITEEKHALEQCRKSEKEAEVITLTANLNTLQEQYDLLKKEHDNLSDLNGLLKEEVETLKLSLEQPKDDDNVSDLNVSLQADIVKLETKLSAYKQENASLLAEMKESRAKAKEYDKLAAEYEEAKAKLASYKTENTELLNEMKEINQVLKERGETISKLEKAVGEMEKLIDTLEKDRDNAKQEKDDLSKKLGSLENDLKNASQKTSENSEAIEHIMFEKENANKLVKEKDALIVSLKEEIERLRLASATHSDVPNEDMSTSTISRHEEHSRMKDLDETFEEKYTKLRLFALKLKKKLNEVTKQLENAEQDKSKLEKLLHDQQITAGIKLQSPASGDQVDGITKFAFDNAKVSELETKVEALSKVADNAAKISAELDKVKDELANKSAELSAEVEAHKVTKENLEKAKRDLKKRHVLSLEMEDYERSLKELTAKMEDSKKKIIQMESTIDAQEGTITAMRTQIKLLEEQIKAEETQNRLTKEELQQAIEDCKEKDNVIQLKNSVISKLELDLEDEKRKNEEYNLEMTSLISAKEKAVTHLGEEKIDLINRLKRQEFKCAELEDKLRCTNIELADLKTEYTSYKVRAQAVLRQNQTVDHSQEEQLKEETAALKAQIDTLTSKMANMREQCATLSTEAESCRRAAAEAQSEVSRAHGRTARLQQDLLRLGQQLESERTQHKLQVSTITQAYKTQISELETKLQMETESLRKQLTAAQENVKVVKVGSVPSDPNMNPYMVPVHGPSHIPKDDSSDNEMELNVSMIPREEGEGSESAPSPPLSKSYTGGASGRSPVPLERLLEEGVPDDEVLDYASLGLTPEQEISELRRKLQIQQQRVKHITVLLSESERECARMSQLSELLKAELRRVRGAAQQPHNTEYMKNVTLKFLTLPPGDERGRLVPVLQKILTLTPDETQKIQAIAKGMDPNPNKGWGSYLPWPGGK